MIFNMKSKNTYHKIFDEQRTENKNTRINMRVFGVKIKWDKPSQRDAFSVPPRYFRGLLRTE